MTPVLYGNKLQWFLNAAYPTSARPLVLERRHLVADRLGRVGRGRPDRLAEFLESGPHLLWDLREVILDAAWSGHVHSLPRITLRGSSQTPTPQVKRKHRPQRWEYGVKS